MSQLPPPQYQEIYDDYWPTQTGAIFHQFAWQEFGFFTFLTGKVLEYQKGMVIPLDRILIDSQPAAGAPSYGYNDDGSLDLTGGKAKSYNKELKCFPLRYHAAKEAIYPGNAGPVTQLLKYVKPNVVRDAFSNGLSYFTSRGYGLQGPDTFKKFSNQFIWTFSTGQTQPFTGQGYVALRLIEENCDIRYIDLHASANSSSSSPTVLDTYQPNLALREKGHAYPLRISVTKSLSQYQNSSGPIAYYDKNKGALTINVPSSQNGYLYTNNKVNTGNPASSYDYAEYLTSFNGSFAILRRNQDNELVSTGLKCSQLFAQNSENIVIESRVVSANTTNPQVIIPIRSPVMNNATIGYTGVVCSQMNGGSPSYDVYAVPISISSAYTSFLDPWNIPEEGLYAEGDAPLTKLVEKYSMISEMTLYDNDAFGVRIISIPLSLLNGQFFPENRLIAPVPSTVNGETAIVAVINHELCHLCQTVAGVTFALPVEGMAQAVGFDTRLSGTLYDTAITSFLAQTYTRFTRGDFTMMNVSDITGPTTYGSFPFWLYLKQQFDFNNQVMRRSWEILSSETLGPLIKSRDFPFQLTDNSGSVINYTGSSAALKQSLQELFNRDIKDVWNDFSISLTVMRNNTSIPARYRNSYPYWIYDTRYSGYPQLIGALTPTGRRFANWWELMDNNGTIPANWGLPASYVGQTILRTLPANVPLTNLKSLRSLSYNVPHSVKNIEITITTGEWRLTVVQFTSDGTSVGSWIQDGPYTVVGNGVKNFDLTTLNLTATGNIRLICSNVTFTGTGTTFEEYYSPEPNTGSISIVSS